MSSIMTSYRNDLFSELNAVLGGGRQARRCSGVKDMVECVISIFFFFLSPLHYPLNKQPGENGSSCGSRRRRRRA